MNDEKYVFSIIIPVYNIESYIKPCLDSILNQIYTNYQVIIVDDGSTDNSGYICDEYCVGRKNWSVIHKENGGVSSARNAGIKCAVGKYFVFVDGDDVCHSSYLDAFQRLLLDKVDIAVCGVNVNGKNIVLNNSQEENGIHDRAWLMVELIKRESVRGFLFNKAFSAEIVKNNKLFFDDSIHMCEDLLFCLNYAMYAKQIAFFNQGLYDYVIRQSSASQSKFNPKRMSVLEAYDQIEKIEATYGPNEGIRIAKYNRLVHCCRLFLMLRKQQGYEEKRLYLKDYIKRNIRDIGNVKTELKIHIIILYAYFLTLF